MSTLSAGPSHDSLNNLSLELPDRISPAPRVNMENWVGDRGRTVLLDTLEGVCDRISDSFKKEYIESHANLTTELETLRSKASQVDRLTEENIALKGEIDALRKASREHSSALNPTSRSPSAVRTPLASKSTNRVDFKRLSHADIDRLTAPELKAEYLRIDQSHAKLLNTCHDLQDALHQSNQLLRERTSSCDQWIEHAKQLGEQSLKRVQRIKKLEAKLAEMSHDPLSSSFPSAAGDVDVPAEAVKQADISVPSLVTNSHDQPSAPTCANGTGNSTSPRLFHGPSEPGRSVSALETVDPLTRESETLLPPLPPNRQPTGEILNIKSEPSSDTPVIVSERSVRKRKYNNADCDEIEPQAKVKMEHSPTSQTANARPHFSLHDSIDFDAESHRVRTPKKQTRYQRSHGPLIDDVVGCTDNGDNSRVMHRIGTQEHKNGDPTSAESCGARRTDLTPINRLGSQPNSDFALQPRDNNQLLGQGFNSASSSKTWGSTTLRRGLVSFAEDEYQNENEYCLNKKRRPNVLPQIPDTPSRAQHSRTSQSRSSKQAQLSELHSQQPRSQVAPSAKKRGKKVGLGTNVRAKTSSNSSRAVPINRNHVREGAAVTTTEEIGTTRTSRLRQAPKAGLKLDDFRINPHANEGYGYAYTDVVRKKNDRACLQGCVKEDCCGRKFRGLAKAGRASTGPIEFQSQLEAYLGDESYRLSTMSEAEKESLWIEAKMRELANASSKHRHRYPRMSTPPGFWRTDFPTTQEGEEDNEEAARLERQIVEERYREAMRPGGLWVFRDE